MFLKLAKISIQKYLGDLLLPIFDGAYRQCYTQAEIDRLLASARLEIDRATKVRFGIIWGLIVIKAIPSDRCLL